MTSPKTDHLHGITLEQLLNELVEHYGWQILSEWVQINCFRSDPSLKSSLKFLRRTPWARAQVEAVFIAYKEGKNNAQISALLRQKAGFSAKKKASFSQSDKPVNPWKKSQK